MSLADIALAPSRPGVAAIAPAAPVSTPVATGADKVMLTCRGSSQAHEDHHADPSGDEQNPRPDHGPVARHEDPKKHLHVVAEKVLLNTF
jgi:hypothetical protein